MRRVFADASYWIALLNRDDELFPRAKRISGQLGSIRLLTTEWVLCEVLSFYSEMGAGFRRNAVEFVSKLRRNPSVEIHPARTEDFESGISLYGARLDKEWSLVDCISFTLMKAESLQDALAADRHFAQAGFVPLLASAR